MTLRECYQMFGGNYEEVLGRLVNEERVERFALKFLNDTSFQTLRDKYASGEYKEAFRAAHTIKGLSTNLGFERLFVSADALTEALRNGKSDNADALYERVTEDYRELREALEKYQAQNIR